MMRRKNPALAGILSIIPGLGQLYNEQYIKGFGVMLLLGLGFLFMVVMPFLNIAGAAQSEFGGFIPDVFAGSGLSIRSGDIFITLLYILVVFPVVWIWGIFDAVLTARRTNEANGYYGPTAAAPMRAASPASPAAPAPVVAPARPHPAPPGGFGPREATVWGIGLVALGILGLGATLDGSLWSVVSRGWPILLVLGGAYLIWAERAAFGLGKQASGTVPNKEEKQ